MGAEPARAWAMLLVPWLLGFVSVCRAGGGVLAPVLLLVCWMLGYFAFFALSQWLRSRMKARYLPAVRFRARRGMTTGSR